MPWTDSNSSINFQLSILNLFCYFLNYFYTRCPITAHTGKNIAEFPIWPNDFKTMPIRENSNTNKIVQTVKLSTYQANTEYSVGREASYLPNDLLLLCMLCS